MCYKDSPPSGIFKVSPPSGLYVHIRRQNCSNWNGISELLNNSLLSYAIMTLKNLNFGKDQKCESYINL